MRLCYYCFILHYIVNLVQDCYYHEENKVSNYIKRCTYYNYHIAETFEGENFRKFYGFVTVHKSFLRKIWAVASFGAAKASNPRKFSP